MGVLKYFEQSLRRTIFSTYIYSIYRENFKRIDEFTAPRFATTGPPCGAGTHASFVDDSACLTADNVCNEGK
jgi:hypothetical protein